MTKETTIKLNKNQANSQAISFKGSFVALITPFKKREIDFPALKRLVEWHINEGTHGIVVCGTTGEFSSLTSDEQYEIVKICVESAQGRLPIIAGINTFCARDSIALIQQAEKAGALGAMVVNPPYIKLTQEGLYTFFKTIHDETALPLILYNNPGRTGTLITTQTLVRLSQCERIVALKDSSDDMMAPLELKRLAKPEFTALGGNDPTAVAFLAHGGQGFISVTANVAPRLCAELYAAWNKSDLKRVIEIRDLLAPLNKVLFIEGNPIPIKYAASLLGVCENELRLPLLPASESTCSQIRTTLEAMHLIPKVSRER